MITVLEESVFLRYPKDTPGTDRGPLASGIKIQLSKKDAVLKDIRAKGYEIIEKK